MKNRIVLLSINEKADLYGVTADEYSAIQPNISMGLLGAYLKSKDIDVQMFDESWGLSITEIVGMLQKDPPTLVGVICAGANPSSSTMSMVGAIKFFKEYIPKKAKTTTFICGGHPTVLPERTMDETGVDFVVRGEGYETIERLYHNILAGKHPKNMPRGDANIDFEGVVCKYKPDENFMTGIPKLLDVNDLPDIDWTLMDPNKYRAHNWHCFGDIENRSPYGVIWTSFGCPYRCSFCCINNVFGFHKYRLRDISSVLNEIDILVNKYGVKHIKILDELFIIKNKRMDEFIEGLEERNYDVNFWAYARMDTVTPEILKRLRKVGVKWVAYGMESVSQNVLSNVHKGYNRSFYDEVIEMTRDAGMYICADFIAGLWLDDYDSMQETYDFAVEKNFEWLNLYPAFAYPGTPMYQEYLDKGRIEVPKDWAEYALYGYKCKGVPTAKLTSAEVLKWRDEKFLDYHNRPEYLSMIEKKFGVKTKEHIVKMVQNPLKRQLLGH